MPGLIWGQGSQAETTKIEMDNPAILAPLCTTAKTEKQVNCRSTDDGIHTGGRVHVHNAGFLKHKEAGKNAQISLRKETRDDSK